MELPSAPPVKKRESRTDQREVLGALTIPLVQSHRIATLKGQCERRIQFAGALEVISRRIIERTAHELFAQRVTEHADSTAGPVLATPTITTQVVPATASV